MIILLCNTSDPFERRAANEATKIGAEKCHLLLWEALADTSAVAMVKLNEVRFKLLSHSSNYPDFAPCNSFQFPNLNIWLRKRRFHSNEESIAFVDEYFEGHKNSYFSDGIMKIGTPLDQMYGAPMRLCWEIKVKFSKRTLFTYFFYLLHKYNPRKRFWIWVLNRIM